MGTDARARVHGAPASGTDPALSRRTAIAITVGVLLGFFVIDGSYLWAERPPRWELVAATVGFVAILGLQLIHSFPGLAPRIARYRYGSWAVQVLLAYLPILGYGIAWGGMAAFVTASAVLVFPAAIGWSLFGLAALGDSLVFFHFGTGWETAVYAAIEAVLTPLIVIGLSRMSDMIVKLHRSREELSCLAVAGERLRFARDLNDVLGSGLSVISLKCELIQRLLAEIPAKAEDELREVLRIARKALADVRSVSRGYREMSLSGEAQAAVSTLAAAGIHTTVEVEGDALPVGVDTVLAAVLREGLTNILRHSRAERCEIRNELAHGTAVLTLINDGVGRPRHPRGAADGGLAVLDSRVRELGGTLTYGSGDRGRFRLEAVVPLAGIDGGEPLADWPPAAAAPVGRPTDGALSNRPPADAETSTASTSTAKASTAKTSMSADVRQVRPSGRVLGHPDVVPRAAAAITGAVLVGYFLAYSEIAMAYHPAFGHGLAVELCLSATLALQLAISFQWWFLRPLAPSWGRIRAQGRGRMALGALVLLQFVPPLFLGPTWVGLPGFVAGTALLTLPATAAWPLLTAVTVACGVELHLTGNAPWDITYQSAYTVICALVVFGLSRMARLASELHRSRAEISRLAVTTERLRFARDLHDLLGFSLSAITLKCELVRRLASARPVQARGELTEVLGIVREALADVRAVAGGSRRMSLTAEAEHAVAVLSGAGIHAAVRLDCGELPGDVETVLATMLREGLTNMLRHSRAEHCEITAERTAAGVRLTLVNDGADGTGAPGLAARPGGGSGIGNLTTRVEAVNGRLTARPRPGGRFELRAEVALLMA
ncbi:sensor histidine kinase [Streptomyces sp. NPDC058961]|uniref:sensor histidine kinase n=1 Tax=Streptomyces sp. NPDC058961 TaxID=3346680 RepID=UPI0036A0E81F